jgi:hypothetical protein
MGRFCFYQIIAERRHPHQIIGHILRTAIARYAIAIGRGGNAAPLPKEQMGNCLFVNKAKHVFPFTGIKRGFSEIQRRCVIAKGCVVPRLIAHRRAIHMRGIDQFLLVLP